MVAGNAARNPTPQLRGHMTGLGYAPGGPGIVWRWCQKYAPVVYQRLKGKVKYKTTTWHMDETYVRVAGRADVPLPGRGQSWRHH